jgi:hypothetical protein
MGGDRAGRAIAGKRDPMKQVGSARAVATSKARIRVARHDSVSPDSRVQSQSAPAHRLASGDAGTAVA